jgi:hypothetical protein
VTRPPACDASDDGGPPRGTMAASARTTELIPAGVIADFALPRSRIGADHNH